MLFIVRPILVAGILAVIGTAAPAQTRPDRPETPQVRTAATAQRSVQPDLATVTLQFTGDGATPAQAGSRLASRADSLRRALATRSEEHTSELQSQSNLVCRLLLEKKKSSHGSHTGQRTPRDRVAVW